METFKISLLIRKTTFGGGRHPKLHLQSHVILYADHLDSFTADSMKFVMKLKKIVDIRAEISEIVKEIKGR